MKYKFIYSVFFVVFLILIGCGSNPQKITNETTKKIVKFDGKAYFAGFALSGDFQQSKMNFPVTSLILEEKNKGISIIDDAIQQKIKLVKNSNFDLVTDSYGDYKKGDGIALAAVLDSEDVSQELIDGKYKIVLTIRGQLIAFNFKEMKVVGSYPVTAEYIDAAPKKQNNDELKQSLKKLYIESKKSFIGELADRLQNIVINAGDTSNLQIKNVKFSNDIKASLIKDGQSDRDLMTVLARNFEKYLSINQNVSVLPFTKDQSVGGRLSARFSNGDVFNLKLPDSDFNIDMEIKKLIKARVNGNNVEDVYGYVAIVNYKVVQPTASKIYFDADIRNALPVTIPKGVSSEDKSHYFESLIQLSNNFTKQIVKPDSEYLETWVESKANLENQFSELSQKVIFQCK